MIAAYSFSHPCDHRERERERERGCLFSDRNLFLVVVSAKEDIYS